MSVDAMASIDMSFPQKGNIPLQASEESR